MWPVYRLWSGEQPDPTSFGNRITEETKILSILLTEYVFTGTTNKYFIKKKKLQSDYHQNFFFFFCKCLI